MKFKTVKLCNGDKINARSDSDNLTLYISKDKAVYKGTVSGYKNSPVLSEAVIAIYCDEAAELSDGKIIQRRNDKLKIN